jgi:very-short-patch-repair endonuclease
MSQAAMGQIAQEAARRLGWNVAVAGEARLAIALSHAGVERDGWELQFRLGPYRLDFAHPLYRIDVEADGWVHTARVVRRRDRERDRQLAAWGWNVVRVDTDSEDAMAAAAKHLYIDVHATARYDGALWQTGRPVLRFRAPS